jgi:hypothetical protein
MNKIVATLVLSIAFSESVMAQDSAQIPIKDICKVAPKRYYELTHLSRYQMALAAKKAGHYNADFESILSRVAAYREDMKIYKCKAYK